MPVDRRGHDSAGSPGVFRPEAADQGDRAGASRLAQHGAEDPALRGDGVRLWREKQPLPRIGPWRDRLDAMLMANEGKAARERLTLIRVFEELRSQGDEDGCDAVRRYARGWRKERGATTAEAYVPLSFAPGEAYKFDWSHEVVLINGATVTVKAPHVRLCHSRMMFVRAFPRETQEMVFDAHDRAFAFFRGA